MKQVFTSRRDSLFQPNGNALGYMKETVVLRPERAT
jgi:hypothetical protein